MKLIGDRIFAECIQAKTQTESGIYVPEATILENNRATVKYVGPKVEHFKPGDVLQYDKNTAVPYTHEGVQGVFINENGKDVFKI